MGGAADGDTDRTIVERFDPRVGTILDQRFRIDCQLAAGGFGAIYRATDVHANVEFALKVLHPQFASDPMVVARFRREGKTLANLRDPHTITAYELGEAPDGTLYIVMELLHGLSLYERFQASGPLPWPRVVHIARGVCSSLAEAHGFGIVHRDLKPANIHLEPRGDDPDFVKVLDFGIAKIVQGTHERNDLTRTGQMVGTVDYMSPEQMFGGEMTPRSDIYTLGVVIYEMIGGRTPFAEAQTATALLAVVLTEVPAPLSRHAQIPPALDAIVARCLAREPEDRYPDVGELADALAEVAAAEHARPQPSSRASGPTAVVAALTSFDDATPTTETPRIDLWSSESRQRDPGPRGPRGAPGVPAASSPEAPSPAAHAAPVTHARGSQHELDARREPGPQPMLDGRGSQPMIDLAAWHRYQAQRGHVPSGPTIPAPDGDRPPGFGPANAAPPQRASSRRRDTTAMNREAKAQRLLLWVLLFLVSTAVTLIVMR